MILSIVLFGAYKSKNKLLKFILFSIFVTFSIFSGLQLENFKFLLLYITLPSLSLSGLIYAWFYEKPIDPIWDIEFTTKQGKRLVRGVARGVAIFGSAGSGKTILIYTVFLTHFARARFAGLIYDFKNGELTELALPLFKDRMKIIALHNPEISVGCNPIHPNYLNGEKDINQVVKVILDNLINNGVGKGDDFFKDSASSLLAGVMMKFWLDHKEYCTLPHIIAFILAVDFSMESEGSNNLGEEATAKFGKLKTFLTSNKRVAIQGSTFILGLASSRQTASVVSTLANALRKIAFPEAFYVLSRNDVDFNINDEKVDLVLSVVNEPKSVEFLSPINACIIHTITKQMMNRGRKQSFILLDEAPTIKLLNMAQIPATMRSFGVATVYCAQDIVQGIVQYGRDGFKEIIANLSTQFFGKANDADTAKFYEGYFELIKEKTRSITQKGDDGNLLSFGGKSTTTGERDVVKHRAHEFTKLKVGHFAFLSDGNNELVNIVPRKIESEQITSMKHISQQKLESNFNKIMEEANSILN
ncbi:type IV secretory system conjugative DNA transfer family protein [Chryseobacterium nematophagum]|nr:type IV secretory system conjugative DNA transfer family protein [Chryseobacterium nematophagum]